MRLLNTTTKTLKSFNNNPPTYAILSHRWRDEEVTFKDLPGHDAEKLKGWAKLSNACDKARLLGCEWVWMDTCCIDKSSSAELQESLNSMYQWYKRSAICFAYLDDVGMEDWESSLRGAVWFTRGWTLQELIAPDEILFISKEWEFIGQKTKMAKTLAEISGVEESVLLTGRTNNIPLAMRLKWMSNRETSREEDMAYSLLGIFGVNMPIIYGEGANAFVRLQEEILKKTDDHSIFAWGMVLQMSPDKGPSDEEINSPSMRLGLIAPSPVKFEDLETIRNISEEDFKKFLGLSTFYGEIANTNYGTRISLPLLSVNTEQGVYLAFLRCQDEEGRILAIYLHRLQGNHFARVGSWNTADLLSVNLSEIPLEKIEAPRFITVTRDAPLPFSVSILALVKAPTLHKALKFGAGLTLIGKGSLGETSDWTENPDDCNFDAQELGPSYLFFANKIERLGLLIAFTIESERLSHSNRNLFSIKFCVLHDSTGDVLYTDSSSAEALQTLVDSWKATGKYDVPTTSFNKVEIPGKGAFFLLMHCNREPNWTNVDSYNDCEYSLTSHFAMSS